MSKKNCRCGHRAQMHNFHSWDCSICDCPRFTEFDPDNKLDQIAASFQKVLPKHDLSDCVKQEVEQ